MAESKGITPESKGITPESKVKFSGDSPGEEDNPFSITPGNTPGLFSPKLRAGQPKSRPKDDEAGDTPLMGKTPLTNDDEEDDDEESIDSDGPPDLMPRADIEDSDDDDDDDQSFLIIGPKLRKLKKRDHPYLAHMSQQKIISWKEILTGKNYVCLSTRNCPRRINTTPYARVALPTTPFDHGDFGQSYR